jgi:hypothetical protein
MNARNVKQRRRQWIGRIPSDINSGMRMRDIIRIVEAVAMRPARLDEAAGTYGFYRPRDDKEILGTGDYRDDHADYILRNPEQFGIGPAEIAAVLQAPHDDPTGHPGMQQMSRLLALAFAKGWARVTCYRSAWFFQAADKQTARRTLIHYYENDYIGEAVLDWGPDPAHPIESMSLYPEVQVKQFVKTGRVRT